MDSIKIGAQAKWNDTMSVSKSEVFVDELKIIA